MLICSATCSRGGGEEWMLRLVKRRFTGAEVGMLRCSVGPRCLVVAGADMFSRGDCAGAEVQLVQSEEVVQRC